MEEPRKLVVLVCFVLCLFHSAECIIRLPGNGTVPALMIFGDSIVDTGSNNDLITPAKCNFPPYGRDFLGATPTGRFSNGKVPSDLIVQELGIKDVIPSYRDPTLQPNDLLSGVNFASGGSGYDPLTPKLLSVLSLPDQLQQFKEYIGKLKENFGEDKTNFILTNSIILVVAGSNDIANSYFAGIRKAEYDIPSYIDFILGYATSFVMELYVLGARRIGVFGSPPLGCLPSQRTLHGGIGRECSQEVNEAVTMFNAKLSEELNSLNKNMPRASIVYIDIYSPLLYIIRNPTKYGFQVVDKGCCGTGTIEASILCNRLEPETCTDESNYVFWDSYHPTERTYKILTDIVLNKYIPSFF